MSQYIACVPCGTKFKLHPSDVQDGCKMRKSTITLTKPEGMEIVIQTRNKPGELETVSKIPVPNCVCDLCNCDLLDGSKAIAITTWTGKEPEQWENAYIGVKE